MFDQAISITNQLPIRRVDNSRDLNQIADIIELCFSENMDAEGREYIHAVRRMATQSPVNWLLFPEQTIPPMDGLVWEENGRIIGNLTLIPARKNGKFTQFIANVAVLPEFRRRGIARKLTQKALEELRYSGAESAWLQVREENKQARGLYDSLGFQQRSIRTQWDALPYASQSATEVTGWKVTSRRGQDWPLQRKWLLGIYPPEINWYLPLHIDRYKPGFLRWLENTFQMETIQHWKVEHDNRPVAFATVETFMRGVDRVWLAVENVENEEALQPVLYRLRKFYFPQRLTCNYPVGKGVDAFKSCGFIRQNTLVWMEYKLPPAGTV